MQQQTQSKLGTMKPAKTPAISKKIGAGIAKAGTKIGALGKATKGILKKKTKTTKK